MSGMKTQATLWTVLLLLLLSPLKARALDAADLTREFANCTGRYSAQMEHHWLVKAGDENPAERRRNSFAAMLDAVRPPDTGRTILAWRIEAKAAQAALLLTATFGTDPARRAAAATHARDHIARCDQLMLGD
ncbi:hypothetical protein [Psychromarinibacter halotolerans]|uniref:Uncharacterized protein n=1 Tax=Psychromarinibacter halotolerans TaxID=1775175 RepID=A0ABV7GXK6_9RHOB|nr:hypothetical protein [Psychromarinibacter halotolerans]MDF0598662.1 hypothetical protein [Psychromarinibacter halotolerans]